MYWTNHMEPPRTVDITGRHSNVKQSRLHILWDYVYLEGSDEEAYRVTWQPEALCVWNLSGHFYVHDLRYWREEISPWFTWINAKPSKCIIITLACIFTEISWFDGKYSPVVLWLGWTPRDWEKINTMLQTTLSNEFCWMRIFAFSQKFHGCLLPMFHYTISQQWCGKCPGAELGTHH